MPRYARVTIVALIEIPESVSDDSAYIADYVSVSMEHFNAVDWSYPKTADGKHFAYGELVEMPGDYNEMHDSPLTLLPAGETWTSKHDLL